MVTIEELRPQHFEQLAEWLSNKELNRWLTGEWRDREITPSILAIAARSRKNRLFLVRFSGEPCGFVGLADIDLADRTAMVWYVLGEALFARRSITSNALGQMVRIAFAEMGLASVYAWIMEDNVASRRVLEKSGFRECGHIRNAANSSGRQVDRVYFDLTSDDIAGESTK